MRYCQAARRTLEWSRAVVAVEALLEVMAYAPAEPAPQASRVISHGGDAETPRGAGQMGPAGLPDPARGVGRRPPQWCEPDGPDVALDDRFLAPIRRSSPVAPSSIRRRA